MRSEQSDSVSAPAAHLAVEVGEGTDDLTDADEEERGEGGRHHEAEQRSHHMVLDLQTQLSRVQKRIAEVVSGAEQQDVGFTHRTVLQHIVTTLR